jgi:ferredoxin
MTIRISDGNSKLGSIPNFSLRPILDCPNCTACAKDCYAIKAFRMYPAVKLAWSANAKAIRQSDAWIADAEAYLAKHKPAFFRIHVAGDFVSAKYFLQWVEIAKRFPAVRFLAFTKAFDQTKGVKLPANFQLINSAFPGMTMPTSKPIAFAGEPAEYTGALRKRAERALVCPGVCDACGACWSLSQSKRDVRFPIH